MSSVDIALRFAGVILLALIALLWLRDAQRKQSGILVALFCFSIASYLLCPPMDRIWQLGVFEIPFFAGCFSAAVFFFLMSRAIFNDGFRLHPWHIGLVLITIGLGGWHRYAASVSPPSTGIFNSAILPLALHQILSLGITVSALVLAYMEKAGDLIEARRRFRDLFVGVSGLYILVVLMFEIILRNQTPEPLLELLNVSAILLLLLAFSVAMMQLGPVFEPILNTPSPPILSSQTNPEAEILQTSLTQMMDKQHLYRQDGLTIARLAKELNMQEYLLRRLINGTMGYRNFNEFLNSYRIADVQRQLCDPKKSRLPILTIAMDSGYSSLGPFNRAFKEITGLTPKNYRAQHKRDDRPDI